MLELLSGSFQAALWSKISPPVSFPPSFQTNCSDFVEPFPPRPSYVPILQKLQKRT